MSMFELSDDVAVVIGATGALGGACAAAMAEAGAKIAVLGRSAERGDSVSSAIIAPSLPPGIGSKGMLTLATRSRERVPQSAG